MKKPNGHLNLLDLEIRNYNGQDCRLKEILNDYKDNISALDIPFSKQLGSDMVSFLQHENTRFPLLEKLTLDDEKLIVENLLKKHAEQLTYLNLDSFDRLNFSHYYPKLETLIVYNIHPDDLVSLLSLCSESLSTLRIFVMFEEMRPVLQQLPELPKLQTLELYNCFPLGETVKSLISKCRQTLTGIVFEEIIYEFDLEDKYFPKLKYMKFQNVDMIQDMISANAGQLETLIIFDIYNSILPNTLSNIKNLFIHDCKNLANILKCASSLQCLVISQPYVFDDLKDIEKMPNLTDFYLLDIVRSNLCMDENIKDFLVKNADTLEFLVLHFNYSSNTEFETMESTPPVVELKKVHTLIFLQENPLWEREREFYKALCPNAQIIMKNGKRGEYIREAVKLRLKYNKADDLFCQEINNMIYNYMINLHFF